MIFSQWKIKLREWIISYFQTWYPVLPRLLLARREDSPSGNFETTWDEMEGNVVQSPLVLILMAQMFSVLSAVFLFDWAFICFALLCHVRITPEGFENSALFLRLDLSSSLIRHENGAFRIRSSNRGIWKRRLGVLVETENNFKTKLFDSNEVRIIIIQGSGSSLNGYSCRRTALLKTPFELPKWNVNLKSDIDLKKSWLSDVKCLWNEINWNTYGKLRENRAC